MSKLLVKFPSRNRPEKFRDILDNYTSRTSGKHEVRFVVTMDSDDVTMNNDEIKNHTIIFLGYFNSNFCA